MRKPAEFEGHPAPFVAAQEASLYRGTIKHVVDGDTMDAFVDMGLLCYAYETFRLASIDTPEIWRPENDAELEHAQQAKARVVELVMDEPVLLRTHKGMSFGRFHADVCFLSDEAFPAVANGPIVGERRWWDLAEVLRHEGLEKLGSYEEEG